jgi:hypothetical protein
VPIPAAPAAQVAPAPEADANLVEVRVQSDVPGATLYVDGVPKGFFQAGVSELSLAPGAYRMEARTGDEVAVAATVTVRDGVPADVALMLPSGDTEVSPPPEPDAPHPEIQPPPRTPTPRPQGASPAAAPPAPSAPRHAPAAASPTPPPSSPPRPPAAPTPPPR